MSWLNLAGHLSLITLLALLLCGCSQAVTDESKVEGRVQSAEVAVPRTNEVSTNDYTERLTKSLADRDVRMMQHGYDLGWEQGYRVGTRHGVRVFGLYGEGEYADPELKTFRDIADYCWWLFQKSLNGTNSRQISDKSFGHFMVSCPPADFFEERRTNEWKATNGLQVELVSTNH